MFITEVRCEASNLKFFLFDGIAVAHYYQGFSASVTTAEEKCSFLSIKERGDKTFFIRGIFFFLNFAVFYFTLFANWPLSSRWA